MTFAEYTLYIVEKDGAVRIITENPFQQPQTPMNSRDEQQSIRKDALQRIKSLRSEGLDRKEIVSILSSDFGIPESSGYRYFQQAAENDDESWETATRSKQQAAKEEAIDVLVVLMRMAVNEGDTEKQHQYALDILNTKSK